MTATVKITDEAKKAALTYGKTVSQGIVAMDDLIRRAAQGKINQCEDLINKETALLLIRGVVKEGVNLSEQERNNFRNLFATMNENMSRHNLV